MTSTARDWLDGDDLAAVVAVFEGNQISASSVSVALPVTDDELVFVLRTSRFPEAKLTSELMVVLSRKVWVTAEGSAWVGRRLQPLVWPDPPNVAEAITLIGRPESQKE